MRFTIIINLCLFLCLSLSAQNQFESTNFIIPLAEQSKLVKEGPDFFPKIENLESPHPGGNGYRDYLASIKSNIKRIPQINNFKSADIAAPDSLLGYRGNFEAGTPNDNDMAISNDGWLVSVVNSTVLTVKYVEDTLIPTQILDYIYSSETIISQDTMLVNNDTIIVLDTMVINDTMEVLKDTFRLVMDTFINQNETSLTNFALDLGTYSQAFDPKVEYDPIHDRFIMVFLNGYTPATSNAVMAFSQTNNPQEGWNFYEIPGNPFDDDTWTDYPMLAVTEGEVFLTINLLLNGVSWELGFVQTIVWQMDKLTAYQGGEMDTKLWSQTNFEELPIRNSIPVQGGSNMYGPNLFLLSNRNFDAENDTIFLMEITGDLSDPNAEFKVTAMNSPIPYGVPPNGRQPNNRMLSTNDGRILGAFLENDQIHFTSVTNVFETGFAGVFHGTIVDPDNVLLLTANVISDPIRDYGYPNLSYSGQFEGDDQFVLTMSYTSPDDKPGHGAMQFSYGEYSDFKIIKQGNRYIGSFIPNSSPVRWGDYSGSQLKYNEPGIVWTSGTFGESSGSGPSSQGFRATWIAKLKSAVTNDPPIVGVEAVSSNAQLRIAPNPVREKAELFFELKESTVVHFELYNMSGQKVQTLLSSQAKAGKNRFSFSVEPLTTGIYILKMTDATGTILQTEKIIIP